MRDSKKQNCQSWRGHCYVRKKGTEAGRESQNCAQVSRGGNQYPQGRPGSRSRASNDTKMDSYKAEGVEGFLPHERNRSYSPELKHQAVWDYLSGKGSLQDICGKYKIRSDKDLRGWVRVYNAHGDFNSVKHSGGGSYMKQGRDTTQEERIQIAKDCIASGKNYGEMAQKYQVSYRSVHGRFALSRWEKQDCKTGVAAVRKIRLPVLNWSRRRSRSSSSSTSCIWQKWRTPC